MHVVQRGHNGCPVFLCEADHQVYLSALAWAMDEYACTLHAYTLMTNHVHLLITPLHVKSLPRMFMSMGSRYVRYFNHRYRRSGTLWNCRYFASLIRSDVQLLNCYRYIELNPVRAGMTADPGEYRWSSYRCNGEGRTDDLVKPHDLYLRLARDDQARREAYRELCRQGLTHEQVDAIRQAWKRGCALE